jgi:hypothetical protein
MVNDQDYNLYKARALHELAQHIGRERPIGMGLLYSRVFERPWSHRINDTRALRQLITRMRFEGIAICSTSDHKQPGYYLAAAGTELEDYCRRFTRRALRSLAMVAKARRMSLPELLGQMQLNLQKGHS